MKDFAFHRPDGLGAAKALLGANPEAKLVAGGMPKASRKLGEEAVETVVAALSGSRDDLVSESADLLYHWLVVLAVAGVPLADVMAELERRTAMSGVEEKAARRKG